jgi:OTU domain-containing protein 6
MDQLQQRHRKEAKDLQAKITQKKKAATKKTRKGVNDECDNLERDMKARHQQEMQALSGQPDGNKDEDEDEDEEGAKDEVGARDEEGAKNEKGAKDEEGAKDKDQNQPPAQNDDPLANKPRQLDPNQQDDTNTQQQPQPPKKKQNRAKARLARRAAEQDALIASATLEAHDIPNLKALERTQMLSQFNSLNLSEQEIRPDGHCLYSAVADQLQQLGLPLDLGLAPSDSANIAIINNDNNNNTAGKEKEEKQQQQQPYKIVRQAAADYILSHPSDFTPFLDEPLDYYAYKIKNTAEWGGQLELMALAKQYNVSISVLQGNGRVEEINPPDEKTHDNKLWLAYYRHGFGLGEHYNSLRKTKINVESS